MSFVGYKITKNILYNPLVISKNCLSMAYFYDFLGLLVKMSGKQLRFFVYWSFWVVVLV